MSRGSAIVKQIVSGNSLVLMGNARYGLPPLKLITLASVFAPLIEKSDNNIVLAEPFAWEAREFLRKLLIGEAVKFSVEYENEGKEFASLDLNGDVALKLVSAGLAKVLNNDPSFCTHNYEDLKMAEEEAKHLRRAIWSLDQESMEKKLQIIRPIKTEETQSFVEDNLKQSIPGIIENVVNAVTYEVYFRQKALNGFVVLAGISLPKSPNSTGLADKSKSVKSEYNTSEATHFVETRLLNRDIEVCVHGSTDSGMILGTVIHPKGNMTELLLKEGFGQIDQKTLKLALDPQKLIEAEKVARAAKLRLWKTMTKPKADWQEFVARVVEVVSGDCYILSPVLGDQTSALDYCEERRVYLASIRCPRTKTRERAEEPWAMEAKEFARKKLIGKKVKVISEYVRETPQISSRIENEKADQLQFVSVWYDNGNFLMNKVLVEEGLAKVSASRSENDRASYHAELLEKETEAASKKKGLHGPATPVTKINELVGADFTKQAKSHLEALKRMGTIEGIIDHVFNGRRFKIRIPSERLAIAMALSGIVCPSTGGFVGGKQRDPEPYGQEALRFSKRKFLQRKITFQISTIDLRGTFIGVAWLVKDCLNVQLVEHGLARVSQKTILPPSIAKELCEAETQARMKGLGVWSCVESDNDKSLTKNEPTQPDSLLNEEYFPVCVSFVSSFKDFFLQLNVGSQLNALQSAIQQYIESNKDKLKKSFSSSQLPLVGKIILAKYKEDEQWYRARVLSNNAKKSETRIFFIDYGNTAFVQVPEEVTMCPLQLLSNPPFASQCELNGVKAVIDLEQAATDYFESLCAESNELRCIIEHIDRTTQKASVLLYFSKDEPTFSELLVAQGLAVVDRRAHTSIYDALLIAQEKARAKRLNAWYHGDIGDESEEEF